jgi:hypothetical protein
MDDLLLPWWTNTLSILGLFVVALAAFHLLFVIWFPLDRIGWKKVDYVWLLLALIGIIGAAGSVRQELARNLGDTARDRVDVGAASVKSALQFGRGPAICRTFIETDHSPPRVIVDDFTRGFDKECRWFRDAGERLPTTPFAKLQMLRLQDFGASPPMVGDTWAIENLKTSIDLYDAAVAKQADLSHAASRSNMEFALQVFAPTAIVVGLALRITKVSGEIKLENADVTPIH